MKKILLLFFLTSPSLLFGQDDTKVKTDSSVIETKYFEYLNSVRVFNTLNKSNKTYYTEYYFNTKKIKARGVYLGHESAGIWEEFAANGKLIRRIDHDKGIITNVDRKVYPYYDLQNRMKAAGDDLIAKAYSKEFLNKHVKWNIDGSSVSGQSDPGNWTDSLASKPDKFLLRYDLKLEGIVYSEMIEFEIDLNGKVLSENIERHGFEKGKNDGQKTFTITNKKAIGLLIQKGYLTSASPKPQVSLHWEGNGSNGFYNGVFRYYVIVKTNSVKVIRPAGRSIITNKFDVFVFDPWTSQFIEKKKMRSMQGWEKDSGSSTGSIPDN